MSAPAAALGHLTDARAKLRRATKAVRDLIDGAELRPHKYTVAMGNAKDAISALFEAAKAEHEAEKEKDA